MKVSIDTAGEYVQTIAAELRLLEAALTGPEHLDGLFGDDYDAEELGSELGVLIEYLNRFCLDVSVRVDQRGADYGATIVVSRTLGGPNCYVERDTNDGSAVLVSAFWGGEQDSIRLNLDRVSTWLDELINC